MSLPPSSGLGGGSRKRVRWCALPPTAYRTASGCRHRRKSRSWRNDVASPRLRDQSTKGRTEVSRALKSRALWSGLVLAALVTVAACGGGSSGTSSSASTSAAPAGQPGKGKPAITLGDKNFTEEFILGQLYAQALRAKGYTVHVKSNIGSSEIIDKAIKSGKIDMYP